MEHKAKLSRRLIVTLSGVLILAVLSFGGLAMGAKTDMDLRWQWPADRVPKTFIVAEVTKVKAKSGGLFGLKKSPSMAGHLPDAQVLTGTVVIGDGAGTSLRLEVPKLELNGISAGDVIGLGLHDNEICICIRAVPDHVSDDLKLDWVKEFACSE